MFDETSFPQILSGVSDKFDQIILLPSNRINSFNGLSLIISLQEFLSANYERNVT